MKLRERISWGRRAVVELRGIKLALEAIAGHLEAAGAPGIDARSGFRSRYQGSGTSPEDEALSYMDDDDRREMEKRDHDEELRGGPAVEGFYDGDDGRVGAAGVVGPTVQEQIDREAE